MAQGLGDGMVNVLPTTSFLASCKNNGTNMVDFATYMSRKFKKKAYTTALMYLQDTLMYFSGAYFNCFYSVMNPSALSNGSTGGLNL